MNNSPQTNICLRAPDPRTVSAGYAELNFTTPKTVVWTEEGGSWWFLQEQLGLPAVSFLLCFWIFELLEATSSLFAIQLEANAHQQHCCYPAWGNCLLCLCPELALVWSEENKKGWCRPVSPSIACVVRVFHLRDRNKAANFNWSAAVYLWVPTRAVCLPMRDA